MGKIIFSMLGKVEDILNEVKKHGENDGVCTRKYITPYRRVDEDGRKWDCLAIGYCNEEPNRLLTFWQDENDDDFHTEDYLSLTNTEQVEIFNTLNLDMNLVPTHKHLATVVELQELAMSMTMEEFVDYIKSEYNYRDNEPYIDFDYHDLTATICLNSRTLSGSIDFWDEEGTWSNTLFCDSVPFKK